jgi:predicted ATPase
VDLAPVRDPRLVPATMARALGLHETGGRSAWELVRLHLRDRQLLLVADNCEHLPEAAPLLWELVAGCPRVAVLATGRGPLRLRGERRFPVDPLPTPEPPWVAPEVLADTPAVELFVKRAGAADPGFALTEANAAAVAEICRRVDGLPLALELAAARVALLEPAALLARLERRLKVLTAGPVDAPDRQRTLRDTLAWSHDLLGPVPRALFRRLAVFAGGWTMDAAEAVCGGDHQVPGDEVLNALQELVDNSLVARRLEPATDEPRFSMLETVREYAEERLIDSGEVELVRARHCRWALELVGRAVPLVADPAQADLLDREQDNLRAALRWSIDRQDAEAGLRLGIGTWPLWNLRGRSSEGRAWLAELLQLPGVENLPALRGQALCCAGHLAFREGELAAAEPHLREALALSEASGDRIGRALCAYHLADTLFQKADLEEAERLFVLAQARAGEIGEWLERIVAVWAAFFVVLVRGERGDFAGARAAALEALHLAEAYDQPRARGFVLGVSGRLASLAGEHDLARAQIDASLRLLEPLHDAQGLGLSYFWAGTAALDRGDRAEAAKYLRLVLDNARETHDQAALVRGLEAVGWMLTPAQALRGLRLWGAAEALRARRGQGWFPAEIAARDGCIAAAVHEVGSEAAEAALATGRATSAEAALADAVAACRELDSAAETDMAATPAQAAR